MREGKESKMTPRFWANCIRVRICCLTKIREIRESFSLLPSPIFRSDGKFSNSVLYVLHLRCLWTFQKDVRRYGKKFKLMK